MRLFYNDQPLISLTFVTVDPENGNKCIFKERKFTLMPIEIIKYCSQTQLIYYKFKFIKL